MTDRFKEQADNLLRSLSPFWFERQDAIAAALSEMHEAGMREGGGTDLRSSRRLRERADISRHPQAGGEGMTGFALDPTKPLPKKWMDCTTSNCDVIRLLCQPHEGYVMARKKRAAPFVLSVRDLLSGRYQPMGVEPQSPGFKDSRRHPPPGGEI